MQCAECLVGVESQLRQLIDHYISENEFLRAICVALFCKCIKLDWTVVMHIL